MSRPCSITLWLGHRPGVIPLVADPSPTRTDSGLDNGYWYCTKDETLSSVYNSRGSDAVDITVEGESTIHATTTTTARASFRATSDFVAVCK